MGLRTRWLGRVAYADAHALQRALWAAPDDYLLLLEHPHVYTMGVRADPAHVLVDPATVGAELVRTDRGGDVTYHGPGQLVGYPILTLAPPGSMPDTPAHVHAVEQLIIDSLGDVGLPGAARWPGYPGVWVGIDGNAPRKIAAVGIRISRGRSMHGFALNVDPDLTMFSHIVPCGITDYGVTSLAELGVRVAMRDLVEAVALRAAEQWGPTVDRGDVAWRVAADDLTPFSGGAVGRAGVRLVASGLDPGAGHAAGSRKPEWVRVKARMGPEYRDLKRNMRRLDLVTVCEEAGCPNIFECWADGTATFMINGERCTRACGFCLVDTRHPRPLEPGEPARVAEAVQRLGLEHAVITAVARDDLPDGGAVAFADTIRAIRATSPGVTIEVLIPDCKGDRSSLDTIFGAQPDVLNHNLETVARLQRVVRPSAGYARSLAVLARAASAGLVTKSGIMLGLGETDDEVRTALRDLKAVGVSIVTMGQYLRPTADHLAVQRWVPPALFAELGAWAEGVGFAHVESSPLTRSSYHAKRAASGLVLAATAAH